MRALLGPAFGALLVVFGLVSPAGAQGDAGPSMTLEWSAPNDCPAAWEVLARIDALSGGGVGSSPVRVRLRGVVESRGPWTLALTLESERDGHIGRRTQEAGECQTLADVVVLIGALLLDPSVDAAEAVGPVVEPAAVTSRIEASSSPEGIGAEPERREEVIAPPPEALASSLDAPDSIRVAPPSRARPEERRQPRRAEAPAAEGPVGILGAGLSAELGVLPRPSVGASATAGLRLGAWSGRLSPYGVWPTSRLAQPGDLAGVEVLRLGTLVEGCGALRVASWLEVEPCLGMDLSALRGRSFNVDGPSRAWTGQLAGTAGLAAQANLSGLLWLRVAAHLFIPIARPTFFLDHLADKVHRPEPVAVRLTVELDVLRF